MRRTKKKRVPFIIILHVRETAESCSRRRVQKGGCFNASAWRLAWIPRNVAYLEIFEWQVGRKLPSLLRFPRLLHLIYMANQEYSRLTKCSPGLADPKNDCCRSLDCKTTTRTRSYRKICDGEYFHRLWDAVLFVVNLLMEVKQH